MTFVYSKLSDTAKDEVFGFSRANGINSSIRYLAETLLGSPHLNGDKVNASAYTKASANSWFEKVSRPSGTSPGSRGIARSNFGTINIGSTSYTDVTNQSVTLVTNGRPVVLGSHGNASTDTHVILFDNSAVPANRNLAGYIQYLRDSTEVAQYAFVHQCSNASGNTVHVEIPTSSLACIDTPPAGTYTYKMRARVEAAGYELAFDSIHTYAYEL